MTRFTLKPVSAVVAPMGLAIGDKPTGGLPRQFFPMKENSRCSVLFHLLVHGGKRETLNVFPGSFDNSRSLVFRSFTRAPLLPPESAVTQTRSVREYS
jgi:hypothetical protein